MTEKIVVRTYDDLDGVYEDVLTGKKKAEIPLPVPVLDIRDFSGDASPICMLTGLSPEDVSMIAGYSRYVVTDPGSTGLAMKQVLTEKEYLTAKETFGEGSFAAGTGAQAVSDIFGMADLDSLLKECREKEQELMARLEMFHMLEKEESPEEEPEDYSDDGEETELEKHLKELGAVRSRIDTLFTMKKRKNGILIRSIRVLPMEIRPMAAAAYERMPYSVAYGLRDAYDDIASRCYRIRHLTELAAPDIILRNEKHRLQKSVDALIGPVPSHEKHEDGSCALSLTSLLSMSVNIY